MLAYLDACPLEFDLYNQNRHNVDVGMAALEQAGAFMRPICLQLKGFTSFKEETILSFTHLDRFVVCGPTGAGKSSLFDALTFALFADAPRVDTGNLADLISLGRKSFSVSLDFNVGERSYRVSAPAPESAATSPTN